VFVKHHKSHRKDWEMPLQAISNVLAHVKYITREGS
jgi:hypothetical protein